ncbi:DUF1365 domain-containing protein [Allorhizobium terrae]|uniref:DUF1365 domain-containing protein n=1 Tax=Allorhizobium terrae TaxID=1848972 RepID=A0A4S3ZNY4_9HYPH|nr:DUF1365 domain-containing protein [Allorhizobium terrae]THF47172.1 DUF1365 domain-containing protein [Allorhizobium terrae]
MSWKSALFEGDVVHHRHRPKKHSLRYKVFTLLIDLDELSALDQKLRLFGHNRRALFSVYDKDHGLGETAELKNWVAQHLADAGITVADLRVTMLCYPRIFGYVFNPLTVYFCHSGEGDLQAILYEVENTFHERHTYIIPASPNSDGTLRHSCAKEMYVSPFVPMECQYHFKITPPTDKVLVAINETDHEGDLLYASFSGKRQTLSDKALLKMLVAYPLMTLKVMGAIHWEALKLWAKGVPVHRHRKAEKPIASSIIHSDAISAKAPS